MFYFFASLSPGNYVFQGNTEQMQNEPPVRGPLMGQEKKEKKYELA